MPESEYGNFRLSDSRKLDLSQVYTTREPDVHESADGKLSISPAYYDEKSGVGVWNLSTGKPDWLFWDGCKGALWAGTSGAVVAWDDRSAHLFSFPADEPYQHEIFSASADISWIKPSGDGSKVMVFFEPTDKEPGEIAIVDVQSGEVSTSIDVTESFNASDVLLTQDSVLCQLFRKVVAYSTSDGKELWRWEAESGLFEAAVDPGSDDYLICAGGHLFFKDSKTGKTTNDFDVPFDSSASIRMSAERNLAVLYLGRTLCLVDLSTKRILATIQRNDDIRDASFAKAKNRLLVVDATDQLTIWDIDELKKGQVSEPLGSLVLMGTKSWLVMDREGRYDASDPNDVTGASYVMEWEGGLEPINVQQLKSVFYEPGLFGKLLGYDPEPRRKVPSLEQIRLFPSVEIERNAKNVDRLEVTVNERDQGGIGKVKVLVNGKQVEERDGSGYFVVNLADYRSYMLPAAQLAPGQGNRVSVIASNKRGDLSSLPYSIDIGIPPGLETPQVNLYGLFVGVGDYAGNRRDLSAPPYDAQELCRAVTQCGERFLPGRVHTKVLSTSKGYDEPSREAILAWLDDVAKKATSSDIVFVFLAGHGTSVIGDARGYFFLTAGADPGDVTPAALNVFTISSDDLQRELAKNPASKQVIVLDTCHSGAAAGELIDSRSVSSDYVRAYEAIKDGSGTWLLAGAAADQLSYESRTVDHGLLTYALLEAIDQVSKEGLRATPSGEAFLDIEKWFSYAAARVESLRNEVGVTGVQRPEIKRSEKNRSFDIGVTRESFRGEVGLKPAMPILLMGTLDDENEEDSLNLESLVVQQLSQSDRFKLWQGVAKHPGAYRLAGQYTRNNGSVSVRVLVQQFDKNLSRQTKKTVTVSGEEKDLPGLIEKINMAVSQAIQELEREKKGSAAPLMAG